MAKAGGVRSIDSGNNKLRFQLAAVCAGIACALLFIAVKFQTKEYLVSTASETRPDRNYTRMWFDRSEGLAGAWLEGNTLTVNRWSIQGTGATVRYELGSGQPLLWAMAPDFSKLAWISGTNLYCRTLLDGRETGSAIVTALPAGKTVRDMDVLSDGSLVTVFSDATLERWDSNGKSLGGRRLDLDQADQADSSDDYVATYSSKAGRMMLYRFRPGQDWMLVEQSQAPDPPFQLVIPAPGIMATYTLAGLRVDGKTKNTPGAVRSAVSHLDDLIIAGDFEKIYVLPADASRDRYQLAEAPPNSTLAVSRTQLAISGSAGTSLLRLGMENRLTSIGRNLSIGSIVSLICAALLCFGPFLLAKAIELLSLLVRGGKPKRESIDVPGTLGIPPPELVQRFASGEGGVWAGAGLSAQSGLPIRKSFIQTMIQTAAVEEWIDSGALKKLQGLCAHEHAEQALDELVASVPHMRQELIANYRAIFCKFASPSRSHDLLTRIPFSGLITTNYDNLIERVGEVPPDQVLTLSSRRPVQAAPFMLKLYGELAFPAAVLLSRAELAQALPASSMVQMVREVMQTRTMLFLGCSLEGLLVDLVRLGVTPGQKHFAAAAVSGPLWHKHAEELMTRFGVQVLPCAEDTIGAALPEFLDTLMREIERVQGGSKSAETVASAG